MTFTDHILLQVSARTAAFLNERENQIHTILFNFDKHINDVIDYEAGLSAS